MMSTLATLGSLVAWIGVLFFLFCAGLVFWYLFNQPKDQAPATTSEPQAQAAVEHPAAGPAVAAGAPVASANPSFTEVTSESPSADV